jgi:hypothetical protein
VPLMAVIAMGAAPLVGAAERPAPAGPPATPHRPAAAAPAEAAVVITDSVRAELDSIFRESNTHWNELAGESQIAQMLGTGKPTQLEYMGCLQGRAAGDTIWVYGTTPARGMKRFQFAVTGTCDHVPDLVGTWHTHPYRAALDGNALKERTLSTKDLGTFAKGSDRALMAVWDADSVDVAVRSVNGTIRHPSALVVRTPQLP